jgi:hypothetical protein
MAAAIVHVTNPTPPREWQPPMRGSRGEDAEAERDWGWACDKINSGVLSVGLYELNPVDDPVS